MANHYSQWRLGPTSAAMTAGRGSSTSCVGLSGSVCAERFPPLSESLGLRAFPVEVDHGRCVKFGTGCVAEYLDERDATHCVPPRPQCCRGVPLPPAVTSEDSAAAGFKFHDQGCARCGSKAIFQLNFSRDLKHQTMFFPRPTASQDRSLVDGRSTNPGSCGSRGQPGSRDLGGGGWTDAFRKAS